MRIPGPTRLVVLARRAETEIGEFLESKLEGWLKLDKTRTVDLRAKGASLDFLGVPIQESAAAGAAEAARDDAGQRAAEVRPAADRGVEPPSAGLGELLCDWIPHGGVPGEGLVSTSPVAYDPLPSVETAHACGESFRRAGCGKIGKSARPVRWDRASCSASRAALPYSPPKSPLQEGLPLPFPRPFQGSEARFRPHHRLPSRLNRMMES
jgi:hypothetical protein